MNVYFDNNASTMVAPEVIAKMVPLFSDHFGNPSSVHRMGRRAAEELADARAKVAALVGAKVPSSIVFTGSGTEADNLAILGALAANPTKNHIITTAVEHPAVLKQCQELAARRGYELTYLPVDPDGQINLEDLQQALRPDTALVSMMMANNETGVVFDVVAAGEMVQKHGALFHVDGVQAAGKMALDLAQWPVDFFSLSGHKIHASKGVGALYVRKGLSLPAMFCGGSQERGRRPGTENVAAIAGFGTACELAREGVADSMPAVAHLRDQMEKSILAAVPDSAVNGARSLRVPTTSNISFRGAEGEGILLQLDQQGVAVSSGAACSSGSMEPSHVLLAMGLAENVARASIRISMSRYTSATEVDFILKVLPDIVAQLRSRSSDAS